uniref:HERV-H LTR-associating 2a, tandem duplicate 2 n=1 Tax=Cyclopterus lumpus TaxID=8103 RepID=A0A8C2ZTG8_CYCLU
LYNILITTILNVLMTVQQIPVHSYYYNKDQFGLQNKHFSGRTCLFNSNIPHGNASLLLRRVKVQDKGRYKCQYNLTALHLKYPTFYHTLPCFPLSSETHEFSTDEALSGEASPFINYPQGRDTKVEHFALFFSTSAQQKVSGLFLIAEQLETLIQSVVMEMTDEMVTCSSHNIYPVPQVTWATDPPSAQEALENSTIKTTDHKGLLTVESTLRILGNLSSYTYFCSVIAADKTQVWTASRKNQGAFWL